MWGPCGHLSREGLSPLPPPSQSQLPRTPAFPGPEDRPAPSLSWPLSQLLALVSQPAGRSPTASLGLYVQEESDGPLTFLLQATGGSRAVSNQPPSGPASSPGLAVVGNGGRRGVEWQAQKTAQEGPSPLSDKSLCPVLRVQLIP